MNNKKILQVARQYIGTPYAHQGRTLGVGIDCVGLVVQIMKACNSRINEPKTYSVSKYSRGEIIKVSEEHFESIEKIEDACILLLWVRNPKLPQHYAVYCESRNTIIHCLEETGVIETNFDEYWKNKVHSIWKIKEAVK